MKVRGDGMEWGDKMAVLAKPTYQPGAPSDGPSACSVHVCAGADVQTPTEPSKVSLLSSGLRGRPDAFVKGTRLTA